MKQTGLNRTVIHSQFLKPAYDSDQNSLHSLDDESVQFKSWNPVTVCFSYDIFELLELINSRLRIENDLILCLLQFNEFSISCKTQNTNLPKL